MKSTQDLMANGVLAEKALAGAVGSSSARGSSAENRCDAVVTHTPALLQIRQSLGLFVLISLILL